VSRQILGKHCTSTPLITVTPSTPLVSSFVKSNMDDGFRGISPNARTSQFAASCSTDIKVGPIVQDPEFLRIPQHTSATIHVCEEAITSSEPERGRSRHRQTRTAFQCSASDSGQWPPELCGNMWPYVPSSKTCTRFNSRRTQRRKASTGSSRTRTSNNDLLADHSS
jgi:hypothetical protein